MLTSEQAQRVVDSVNKDLNGKGAITLEQVLKVDQGSTEWCGHPIERIIRVKSREVQLRDSRAKTKKA